MTAKQTTQAVQIAQQLATSSVTNPYTNQFLGYTTSPNINWQSTTSGATYSSAASVLNG